MLLTNEMNGVGVFATWHTNQKVIRLDIAVNEGFLVDRLHTGNLEEEMSNFGGRRVNDAADHLQSEWQQGLHFLNGRYYQRKGLPFVWQPYKRS